MADSVSMTLWSRIQPMVRTPDFLDNLQARVADPFWLIGRQWQLGELQGEDAGSLVNTNLVVTASPMTKLRARGDTANGTPQPYSPNLQPLETLVERELVRTTTRKELRTATEAGQHFLRLLEDAGRTSNKQAFIAAYPIDAPAASADVATQRHAHVMRGRVPDGYKLEAALRAAAPNLPATPAIPAAERPAVTAVATAWLAWWSALVSEAPAAQSTWVEERLEHRFEVAVQLYNEFSLPQQQIVLNAQEYAGGRLDWSTFDVRAGATMAGTASSTAWANKVITFQGLPTPIEFPGMPVPRYWEMEEGRVDLSRLEPAADDLGRMLLMEFALIYSNDWQVIPIEAPVGTILRVSSLTATDTFGNVTSIPASAAVGDSNDDWGMYQLSVKDAAGATVLSSPYNTPLFLLPPVVGQLVQGPLIEQVRFMRDEMANLAWAVERTVTSQLGKGLDRLEDEKVRRRAQATEGDGRIAVSETARYSLGSSVPRYWLPLVPVPTVTGGRQNKLLLGAMLDPQTQAQIPPLGTVLKPASGQPFRVWDEEIPRAGAHLSRRYELARWSDGSTHLWIARRKGVGRGEGSSGLAFDELDETEPTP